ncbi:Peroxin 13, N-terminal [Cinara cedri]|uniref:Peroxin-13 n=1 Tax=Cinara cedri TaxID=506608 RepID=A0A5E4MQN4_9HEMI|nr:Peroxin 13, N-terminal [Cinara cedri]
MDDREHYLNDMLTRTNQLLQNAQAGAGPGRVAPPMHIPSMTSVGGLPNLSAASAATAANSQFTRNNYRRLNMPIHIMPPVHSTNGSTVGYNATYNNYPYRPYMSMNGYNPYGQPTSSQYQNPVVIAAAENSRPAFESIQSVVQSFNAVSMMLESTFTAMHMSFQALLGVAENFTRLRMFMMKLYSTIVSFKLARWFLAKLFYLLRMVRGNRLSAEEDLWETLSSTTQGDISSDARSWPLVVFTGLLVATPYFVYKLLNSVTPICDSPTSPIPPTNPLLPIMSNFQPPPNRSSQGILIKSPVDWSCQDPKTIALVKGQNYFTTQARLSAVVRNGGWLLVDDPFGQRGYVPLILLKPQTLKPSNAPIQSVAQDTPGEIPNVVQPIKDVNGVPIIPSHTLMELNKVDDDNVM